MSKKYHLLCRWCKKVLLMRKKKTSNARVVSRFANRLQERTKVYADVYQGIWYRWGAEGFDLRKRRLLYVLLEIINIAVFAYAGFSASALNFQKAVAGCGMLSIVPFLPELRGVFGFCISETYMMETDYKSIDFRLVYGALIRVLISGSIACLQHKLEYRNYKSVNGEVGAEYRILEDAMRKMSVRADDVGYTVVNNIGAFESIENGVVTSADVMLEKNYDPYLYYAEDRGGMWEKFEQGYKVVTQSWHPGYLDYYMYQLGDQGPARNKFGAIRTKDVEALCSERLKKWITDNQIVLVSYTDALFGRNAYQNHLRFTGSELYMK